MILKDGGNQFSGSAFMGGTRGIWVQQQHRRRAARAQLDGAPTASTTSKRSPASLGGPILQGQAVVDPLGPASVDRDDDRERPEVRDDRNGETVKVTNDLVRAQHFDTPHVSGRQNVKIAGFLERWWHKKGHSIGAGTDIRAGEQRDPKNAHHAIGN